MPASNPTTATIPAIKPYSGIPLFETVIASIKVKV